MNILILRALLGFPARLSWATGKLREATALRRRVKKEEAGEDRLVQLFIGQPGEPIRQAVLLEGEVQTLFASQPLKDGFAHAAEINRVAAVFSALGKTQGAAA